MMQLEFDKRVTLTAQGPVDPESNMNCSSTSILLLYFTHAAGQVLQCQ